jgi:hypothetical protein
MTLSEYAKATLYCLVFEAPGPQTVVYIQAGTQVAAIRKAMDSMMCLYDVGLGEVSLTGVASYYEMIQNGSADVESFRIFEMSWRTDTPDEWVRNPLFLSNDRSLLGTWAALMLDLATEQVELSLKRLS